MAEKTIYEGFKGFNTDDVLGIGKAVEKLADPVIDFMKRIAGPAADEIGLSLQDQIRVFRAKQQYRLFEKMQRFFVERNLTPNPIALKVLLPAVEYASMEDDETLHTMWANLLMSAATTEGNDRPYPGFTETLKQLTPQEARLWEALHDQLDRDIEKWNIFAQPGVDHPYRSLGNSAVMYAAFGSVNQLSGEYIRTHFMEIQVSIDNLVRLHLLEAPLIDEQATYRMSAFGAMFAMTCRNPGARKDSVYAKQAPAKPPDRQLTCDS